MARNQLHLIDPHPGGTSDQTPDHIPVRDTRLDERTKAIGRAGLAQARAALAAAERRRTSSRPGSGTGRPTAA